MIAASLAIPALALRRGAVTPRPLQIVATGGHLPQQTPVTSTATTTTRQDRSKHYVSSVGASELRVAVCNYYVNATFAEASPGSSCVYAAAIEMNGVTARCLWSGAATVTLSNGQALALSDPLSPADFGLTSFAGGAAFYVRQRRTVPVGSVYLRGFATAALTQPLGDPAGSIGGYVSDDANDQLMNTGALVATGITADPLLMPLAVIGRSLAPQVALLAVGDSLLTGAIDVGYGGLSDGSNGGGFVARACYAGKTAFASVARFGDKAVSYAANNAKRAQLYPYATHVLTDYGTNDIVAGSSASAIVTAQQATWAAIKAAGIGRVEQMLILPRTTSTDAWKTTANQMPLSNFATGGVREALNTAFAANVGSNGLDAVFDLNSGLMQDATATDKWSVDGVTNYYRTGDGTHFDAVPASSAAAATALATRIAGWTGA